MSLPYLQPYLGLSNGLNTLHAAGGGGGGGVGGWVELGRTTLGSSNDNITVSGLSDKRYYMCLVDNRGASQSGWRLNGDTGSNYTVRRSTNGGSDTTQTSANKAQFHAQGEKPEFAVAYWANYSTKEKLGIGHTVSQYTAGAGTAPLRNEPVFKWANTSSSISSFTAYNAGANPFPSGSELVVLGYDPADSHTNNFWEELASVSGTGSSTSLDTSTFTAKKYLWIQAFIDAPTSVDAEISVGNGTIDSGSNYSYRSQSNGGADATGTSTGYIALDSGTPTVPSFMNIFVVNNASNEKLFIAHQVDGNTASAGTAPDRRETVGKWANTSSQINRIQIYNNSATNFTTSSIMKVWGAD